MKIENLHFTHYGFVQKNTVSEELKQVLSSFRDLTRDNYLQKVIIDIDERKIKEVMSLDIRK